MSHDSSQSDSTTALDIAFNNDNESHTMFSLHVQNRHIFSSYTPYNLRKHSMDLPSNFDPFLHVEFVETFFVYYRTPIQIFARFNYELRLEQWVVGEIQNKITLSHGNSQWTETREILWNITISSRSWTFPSLRLSHARPTHTSYFLPIFFRCCACQWIWNVTNWP